MNEVDFRLKWQLTAAERTDLKFDSSDMISTRMIFLTERQQQTYQVVYLQNHAITRIRLWNVQDFIQIKNKTLDVWVVCWYDWWILFILDFQNIEKSGAGLLNMSIRFFSHLKIKYPKTVSELNTIRQKWWLCWRYYKKASIRVSTTTNVHCEASQSKKLKTLCCTFGPPLVQFRTFSTTDKLRPALGQHEVQIQQQWFESFTAKCLL